MKKTILIATHSGGFHPDDVCAVATLSIYLKGNFRLVRTRDPKVLAKADYVVDVGGKFSVKKKLFDHHQPGGGGVRGNKIPYASFGLVWKTFGKKICGSAQVAKAIDEKLVQSIDAIDNGIDIVDSKSHVYPYLFGYALSSQLPTWKEQVDIDKVFLKTVAIAKNVIEREIIRERHKRESERFVRTAYMKAKDKRIVILGKNYAWGEVLSLYPEPLLVLYPQEHNWHVKAVRDSARSFKNRIDFPRLWAGKRVEELREITGVSDAQFCHTNRFLAVAKSREGAMALARLALSPHH